MKNQYIILIREELYERVWAKPMSELASEYGMSDKGLAKKCKRYQIPAAASIFAGRDA